MRLIVGVSIVRMRITAKCSDDGVDGGAAQSRGAACTRRPEQNRLELP